MFDTGTEFTATSLNILQIDFSLSEPHLIEISHTREAFAFNNSIRYQVIELINVALDHDGGGGGSTEPRVLTIEAVDTCI